MTVRARKGRFFPLPVTLVIGAVRQGGLRNREDKDLPVILANPRPRQERELLAAELRPLLDLTLFSLALDTPIEEGVLLWESIVDACSRLRTHRLPKRPGQGPVYAFLGGFEGNTLRIAARWYHFQTRKYRGTDKFTGGLNRKLIRIEEHPVTLTTAPAKDELGARERARRPTTG